MDLFRNAGPSETYGGGYSPACPTSGYMAYIPISFSCVGGRVSCDPNWWLMVPDKGVDNEVGPVYTNYLHGQYWSSPKFTAN